MSPNRVLPYTLLITIGPSVTAATSLFVVRYLMCHAYYNHHPNKDGIPPPGDERCNISDVQGLTASLLAGLTTLDGLLYIVRTDPVSYICLLLNGIFVSASTKAAFTPSLCISDLTDDENRSKYYSRLESMALFGPCLAFVISALTSRYTPYVTLPYYIALASQFLAAAYAFVAIRETLSTLHYQSHAHATADDNESTHSDSQSEVGSVTAIAIAVKAAAIPVKPLRVLIPYRDERGVLRWELLALAITTRGFYLFLIFPFVLRYGRAAFHWLKTRKMERRMKQVDAGGEETRPLLDQRASVASDIRRRNNAEEANHFDAPSYQYVLASFILVALGSGDVPSYKSVFIATVPDDRATEALAALDMVLNIAKLTSPPLLGALYTVFVRRGQPEVVFLAASINE
ncbi:hypothetical protein QFC21_005094 [Naganishia friedmannii]|uniref:Uncharacterized protein n=1 Tax=Naganishia friedmannii TaxID=89922 RepID=A0ACC2VCH3_9TREE|nr:hypothetical protein QFC21_005094 [Naganishia friedmannii]